MKLFTREVIATMSTVELIAYWKELIAVTFDIDGLDDCRDDVELELIRRDDVPEEYHDLIDELQENWSDDFED